ncbi:hypothetical protein PP405_14300 [Mycobacteroides abscessus]|nr:hypothetical protein [Mycobacteroides abscessus]MDM2142664.1 hypothetical protein [Mycobacteroides abscessus]MDM2153730.1 hypothetical protein [Mycobacteroides abscessus]MDM2182763.1 hypothetical protein [Mycobacteroides abscessus]MDM2226960.1 hypothetical protein [Mycobacteroides abscessus]
MALAALIVVTLLTVGGSLWIRRMTWSCSAERAATVNITLQGAAVALMSPWASEHLGRPLHALTGQWNVEDWIAHDLYIVAASAIVLNAVSQLSGYTQAQFKRDVELPATMCIPILFLTFSLGTGSEVYRADFFRVPTDAWLTAYWITLCGMLIHLLWYGYRALIPLRNASGSRLLATVYSLSALSGMAACVVRVVTAVALPGDVQDTFWASFIVWLFACACGAGFAAMSAKRWRDRETWFTAAPRHLL